MGDATANEQIVFLIIMAAVPTLLFGLPIATLMFLSARRQRILTAKAASNHLTRPNSMAWLFALLSLFGAGVIAFFLTAVGFTT